MFPALRALGHPFRVCLISSRKAKKTTRGTRIWLRNIRLPLFPERVTGYRKPIDETRRLSNFVKHFFSSSDFDIHLRSTRIAQGCCITRTELSGEPRLANAARYLFS